MQDLDDPCQGIVLPPYANYMELGRKLQILNEALLEHGITAVSQILLTRCENYQFILQSKHLYIK